MVQAASRIRRTTHSRCADGPPRRPPAEMNGPHRERRDGGEDTTKFELVINLKTAKAWA
jgi:hypothetical protein